MSKEAKLIYGDGSFQVLERGDYVLCAVNTVNNLNNRHYVKKILHNAYIGIVGVHTMGIYIIGVVSSC